MSSCPKCRAGQQPTPKLGSALLSGHPGPDPSPNPVPGALPVPGSSAEFPGAGRGGSPQVLPAAGVTLGGAVFISKKAHPEHLPSQIFQNTCRRGFVTGIPTGSCYGRGGDVLGK